MSFSAYVICATPRSGSTLLCDLLTSSGVAGQPNSYLRSEDIDYWAEVWGVSEPKTAADPAFNRAYLSAMIRAGTADTGIFGLRLMWRSVNEAIERLRTGLGGTADLRTLLEQEIGPTLFIHLSRRKKTAQAVSLVRAKQTGLWHVAADGSERERIAPVRPPVFDPSQIDQAYAMLRADDESWVSFFDQSGIEPMHLFYEDLAAQPQKVLADTLIAIDRDPSLAATIIVQTAKMADDMSLDWTKQVQRNYRF
ncbi:Stf0 family sulfotransferase [Glacieibacterium megasporae]|uniref:Stf0 family sulfotransferase n=1 Tax=Glacieibacterium megasporae TaxID=2835787 RepID=UPI001C1DECC3|nr:Stf0 family sulfotransferase [Polymorphobacter megasporae]UAJ12985.1 Stf0 sulfotransferase family protein [Polymorphobacter megasporae]